MRTPLNSLGLLSTIILIAGLSDGRAQVPPEQAAEMLLNSARKAYNEQNYPFAAAKFQEYVQKFGGMPGVHSARYGLALCHLDGPEQNFEKALEPLGHLVGNTAIPEYPYALYYLGLANRGLAINDLNLAATKQGDEQRQIQARAQGRLNEAARLFTAATTTFSTKLPKEMPKDLPKELDWAARARCDQAEMELRSNKTKEARATTEPFVKDPLLQKSNYKLLGLYYHGFAAFLMKDYLVAGQSLNQLTPFSDPVYGTHARYLMGRIYQVTEEADKAAAMYEGVLSDFDKQKKEAVEKLKRPDLLKNNPTERARLETLVKNPPPDHVSGSLFWSAAMLYEAGKFGEALPRFQSFAKDFPTSPLEPEATLRVGYCQVQLKQFPEAIAILTPLVDKQPRLADQALFWLGKAQVGTAINADPAKPQDRENGLKTSLATLRTAADRATQLAATDPDAKIRRSEILLELADTMQLAKQFKEAVPIYEQLLNEKALPARAEEITQRFITALHLLGDYPRSDAVSQSFQKDFPRSALTPLILFRMAENSYFTAMAAEKRADVAERTKQLDESLKRYKLVIDRYPEFERLAIARYGVAMCHFKRGEFENAQKALESIPAGDRTGDLALAPYLLAECLIRLAPTKADDALQIGMLQEKLQQAQQNLDAFIGANPKAPETPDALLKLGVCQTRLGALIAIPQERNQALTAARQTLEKLIKEFPSDPAGSQAVMERAKCIALMGDKNQATNELRRFTADPLQQSPVAPTAVVYLATLLREQNKAEEAANILAAARQRHEPTLAKDPERIALLRFHHGVCLQEAGKLAEARAQLDTIPQVAPGKAIAVEAILRSGQCRVAEGRKIIETAKQQLAMGNLKTEQRDAANNLLTSGFNVLGEAALTMRTKADDMRDTYPGLEARGRLFYEAAWAWRTVAEREITAARAQLQIEKQKQLQAEADKKAAPGSKSLPVPLPEIARALVPVQPSEDKARKAYEVFISSYSETLLSIEARFELAEMLAERDELDPAIKLLKDALDKEPADNKTPSAELLDRIRIRLAGCLAAKKEYKEAVDKLLVVADNPKSPLVAQGNYRAGECYLELGEADKAVARFAMFRDKPEFHNLPGISDKAILRLGHALGTLKQWEPSRQALILFTQRYAGSPWIHEARYGLGWAAQNLGQFDQAVEAYNAVIAGTTTELAAKAHLQIGLCRLEQKRYGDAATALLVVPYTFDYPDLSAAALTEAARALNEDKKPEQAERLLRRVLREYPLSDWAKIAQKRLDESKK